MVTLRTEIRNFKKDGTAKVNIILTQQGRRLRLPTSITVTRNDLTKTGKLRNAQTLQYVQDIVNDYRRKINAISLQADTMTLEQIAEHLQGTPTGSVDFLLCFRQYIEECKAKGLRNYKAAYNSLCRYIKRQTMDVRELTYNFLDSYSKTLTGRTPSLYIGAIRHVFMWARLRYNDEERGIVRIPYNPFERFRVPRQPAAEKRSLSTDTIRRIFALPYQQTRRNRDKVSRYNLALDMFRLSFCLAGMNAADLYNCSEIEGSEIHYFRVKTTNRRKDRAEMRIKIPPQAMPIAERYFDRLGKRVFRFYRMYACEPNFGIAINLGLKEIGKQVGVERLQFYAARHSWATIARNDLRIGKDIINDALNHVDPTMAITDVYIRKSFDHVNEANKMVVDYIFSKLPANYQQMK